MTSSCAESRKAAYIDAATFVWCMYFLTVHTGLVFAVSVTEVFRNQPDSFILLVTEQVELEEQESKSCWSC